MIELWFRCVFVTLETAITVCLALNGCYTSKYVEVAHGPIRCVWSLLLGCLAQERTYGHLSSQPFGLFWLVRFSLSGSQNYGEASLEPVMCGVHEWQCPLCVPKWQTVNPICGFKGSCDFLSFYWSSVLQFVQFHMATLLGVFSCSNGSVRIEWYVRRHLWVMAASHNHSWWLW